MRKLARQDCSILSLVERKWYRMIESGKKLEEYLDDSTYWRKRINNWWIAGDGLKVVEFRLGKGKKAPRMWFTVNEVFSRAMALSFTWGEPECRHFAIALGSRVEVADEPEA